MEIKSKITNRAGQVLEAVYRDIDNDADLEGHNIHSVHAFCFYGDKLVLVYADSKGRWSPPGGGVEPGETAHEAVVREVKEETNMKVLKHRFVGFQQTFEPKMIVKQTRSVCIVEPYGAFIADSGDGEITKIDFIDPKDYKKYFDWGNVGEHVMERVMKLKAEMDSKI